MGTLETLWRIDLAEFAVFCGLWLAAAAAPGGNSAFTVSVSSRFGFWAGVVGALGFVTILVLFVTLVAFGLDFAVSRITPLLDILRWLGVSYLLFLAFKLWRAPAMGGRETPFARIQPSRIYVQGALVCLTNPKVMIFVAAVIPQALNPDIPSGPQLVLFAISGGFLSFAVHCVYSYLGHRLGKAVPSPRARKFSNRAIACVFVLAAIGLGVASFPEA